jgi:hypothetical protein
MLGMVVLADPTLLGRGTELLERNGKTGGVLRHPRDDIEQRRQAVLTHGVEHVVPLACQLDERGASVLTVSRAVHEPLADEAVDDPAGVGLVHGEVVGQGADASRAVGCDRQEDPVLRDGQGNRCGGHGPQGDAHQHTAEVEQRLRSA